MDGYIITHVVTFKRAGCIEFGYFRNYAEYKEWFGRQMEINPETKIVKIINRKKHATSYIVDGL